MFMFVPPLETPIPTLIPTLAGSYYTDPDVFEREQRAIFEGDWLCVARSGDIGRTGQFQTVQAGRESVLVVRQRDGGLRALLNVCSHRGARVCTEESGHVSRYLRCPYHAWSYELNGRLAAARISPRSGLRARRAGVGIVERLDCDRDPFEKKPHDQGHDRRKQQPAQRQHREPAQQAEEPVERPPGEQGGVVERHCGREPHEREGQRREPEAEPHDSPQRRRRQRCDGANEGSDHRLACSAREPFGQSAALSLTGPCAGSQLHAARIIGGSEKKSSALSVYRRAAAS